MKTLKTLVLAMVVLALGAGSALADEREKGKKQAEIRQASNTALERFYKAEPKLKNEVAAAPGYAVFTTFGLSFLIGGAGGSGLVQDNKTKTYHYMKMAQASAGLQLGASETQHLIVFKTAAAMNDFVNKGWEVGVGGGASAGTGKSSVGGTAGANAVAGAQFYTITKTGLEAGGAVAGTKFWKDKELN
jgi:lipid-binding SYLF domain-containing protein